MEQCSYQAVHHRTTLANEAQQLVDELAAEAGSLVSPSVYESARLVSSAPWLDGHASRVRFLIDRQQDDGTWGGPAGYTLAPTLSAIEALLVEFRRDDDADPVCREAIDLGLRSLAASHNSPSAPDEPDMIAWELLVPWLASEVNDRLEELRSQGKHVMPAHAVVARSHMDDQLLNALRDRARRGIAIGPKFWHSLEFLGDSAHHASFVLPVNGSVGCSPAATAAWLGRSPRQSDSSSVSYLVEAQARLGGPVPGVSPISVFEVAWVLSSFASASVDVSVSPRMLRQLSQSITTKGAPAGLGLPPDSDDTAGALYALSKLGAPHSADCLFHYEGDEYFQCFEGERTPSTSTNAHILDILPDRRLFATVSERRRRGAISKVMHWLIDVQGRDGAWQDKWHASPYYATMCCTLSLVRLGLSATSTLTRTVRWILDTQRIDGSWGRWQGTVEETAYAVRTLITLEIPNRSLAIKSAIAHGAGFLITHTGLDDHPPLWHDKELYTPLAVVKAARISSLYMAISQPDILAAMSNIPLIARAENEPETGAHST
ncbi:prenyltransferase/squalene oxidase repeat-containing protein [Streptomyces sp. SID13031]|uniref:prenyltransferase/squalene oxidase repeat-containing protein n=1 Tax=Streptomyces sp. SID13031 TaxID=2706046 RepID=UPI0013CB4177|nr:prenyltransferase/squalene oxidase repeat-containing protein [Streptomyces sp. SID13031]NEA36911.1 terpene cyclase/mutase family protein [Streptomyces sp. SID13031]